MVQIEKLVHYFKSEYSLCDCDCYLIDNDIVLVV